jgi:diadenosine tetraphosphate (Ap4A) HIT family hydrolase
MHAATLKQFTYSELRAHPVVCLKGTCYLITKEHYVELFDLDDTALLGFMKEAQVAAKVLKEVTGAVKINYEIHGNTAAHLHMHLFPRYLDDPFPGVPIDYHRVEPSVYRDKSICGSQVDCPSQANGGSHFRMHTRVARFARRVSSSSLGQNDPVHDGAPHEQFGI